jgi:hypothetical protein
MLLKYGPVGALDWTLVWSGLNYHSVNAMTLDNAEAVIVAGSDESGAGHMDLAAERILPDGTSDWVVRWDSNSGSDEWATDVTVDPAGNVYVVGITDGFSATHTEILLQCYDAAGALQWSRTWGRSGSVFAQTVDVDDDSNVYIGGYTQGSGLTPDAVLLIKYDAGGTLLWQRRWTAPAGVILANTLMVDGESVCLAGSAPNNGGSWQDVTGTSTAVAGVQPTAVAIAPPIMPTEDSPAGTEQSPVGVLDTGGGGEDGLVVKTSAN